MTTAHTAFDRSRYRVSRATTSRPVDHGIATDRQRYCGGWLTASRPVDHDNGFTKGANANGARRRLTQGYRPAEVEERWKARWAADDLYRTPECDGVCARPAYYVLEFFPYPSGSGLSVGHLRNYVAGDVAARQQRMRGFDVLHPMGWDAFGLPAENRARDEGKHPTETTRLFAANYRRQLDLVSCSYDWSRELFSSDPRYYRWTQWLFLLLHERNLAYRGRGRQWWCPECRTVLANEQVQSSAGGAVCWRDGAAVVRREVEQWYFRITAYADRLLRDLEQLDWPEGIIAQQRHWIGRREGAEIGFPVPGSAETIWVFTTRPETLFGATALVLSPEHPAVARLATPSHRPEVAAYVDAAARRGERERQTTCRRVSAVYTGARAIHPMSNSPIPVWVADYVLPDHGTGAVMAVPAHDRRDAELARAYGLRAQRVIELGHGRQASARAGGAPSGDPASAGGRAADVYEGGGCLVASGPFSGMDSEAGGRAIIVELEGRGLGRVTVTYRLRDWAVGRQRYWGAPIPIVRCRDCGDVPVPLDRLPVLLPDVDRVPEPKTDAAGQPRAPLAAIPGFVATDCPRCGRGARRETETMDGFACSSWYFLRFTSPRCQDGPWHPRAAAHWMPVDLYIGGAEHAVMHLLYARFWTKVLYDAGLVPVSEPFPRLRNQGMILDATGQKMAKSRPQHVVTPDEAVSGHGADAVRAYELFIAPFEQDVAWRDDGLAGVSRWLARVWRLADDPAAGTWVASRNDRTCEAGDVHGGDSANVGIDAGASDDDAQVRHLRHATHRAIFDVTTALDGLRYNVAVARLMSFTNSLLAAAAEKAADDGPRSEARDRSGAGSPRVSTGARAAAWDEAVDTLLLLMAPITPHIAEELWSRRGGPYSIHRQQWPTFDPRLTAVDEVEIVIQVDGVVRSRAWAPHDADEAHMRQLALSDPAVRQRLAGRPPRRLVVVPGRLVNVVTR